MRVFLQSSPRWQRKKEGITFLCARGGARRVERQSPSAPRLPSPAVCLLSNTFMGNASVLQTILRLRSSVRLPGSLGSFQARREAKRERKSLQRDSWLKGFWGKESHTLLDCLCFQEASCPLPTEDTCVISAMSLLRLWRLQT